jgi:hypothetical protein
MSVERKNLQLIVSQSGKGRESLVWHRKITTKVRGVQTQTRRWIFKSDKNPQHAVLRRGSKAVGADICSQYVKHGPI